ncbi:hypothetical protein PFUGPA_03198 [Plasmodium falciparum Palo Alto/Uganda]|uniref:Uncharacterized protein n=1 Tax=Plasmodium falciparum (isolate Palo Alto / Uganda) TaxID=57270 RepID=W4IX72_PLAFP|nr:hypothetical protein PFUGPA_03198 [Plasmodium falciparum Palo Alto/Uganda]
MYKKKCIDIAKYNMILLNEQCIYISLHFLNNIILKLNYNTYVKEYFLILNRLVENYNEPKLRITLMNCLTNLNIYIKNRNIENILDEKNIYKFYANIIYYFSEIKDEKEKEVLYTLYFTIYSCLHFVYVNYDSIDILKTPLSYMSVELYLFFEDVMKYVSKKEFKNYIFSNKYFKQMIHMICTNVGNILDFLSEHYTWYYEMDDIKNDDKGKDISSYIVENTNIMIEKKKLIKNENTKQNINNKSNNNIFINTTDKISKSRVIQLDLNNMYVVISKIKKIMDILLEFFKDIKNIFNLENEEKKNDLLKFKKEFNEEINGLIKLFCTYLIHENVHYIDDFINLLELFSILINEHNFFYLLIVKYIDPNRYFNNKIFLSKLLLYILNLNMKNIVHIQILFDLYHKCTFNILKYLEIKDIKEIKDISKFSSIIQHNTDYYSFIQMLNISIDKLNNLNFIYILCQDEYQSKMNNSSKENIKNLLLFHTHFFFYYYFCILQQNNYDIIHEQKNKFDLYKENYYNICNNNMKKNTQQFFLALKILFSISAFLFMRFDSYVVTNILNKNEILFIQVCHFEYSEKYFYKKYNKLKDLKNVKTKDLVTRYLLFFVFFVDKIIEKNEDENKELQKQNEEKRKELIKQNVLNIKNKLKEKQENECNSQEETIFNEICYDNILVDEKNKNNHINYVTKHLKNNNLSDGNCKNYEKCKTNYNDKEKNKSCNFSSICNDLTCAFYICIILFVENLKDDQNNVDYKKSVHENISSQKSSDEKDNNIETIPFVNINENKNNFIKKDIVDNANDLSFNLIFDIHLLYISLCFYYIYLLNDDIYYLQFSLLLFLMLFTHFKNKEIIHFIYFKKDKEEKEENKEECYITYEISVSKFLYNICKNLGVYYKEKENDIYMSIFFLTYSFVFLKYTKMKDNKKDNITNNKILMDEIIIVQHMYEIFLDINFFSTSTFFILRTIELHLQLLKNYIDDIKVEEQGGEEKIKTKKKKKKNDEKESIKRDDTPIYKESEDVDILSNEKDEKYTKMEINNNDNMYNTNNNMNNTNNNMNNTNNNMNNTNNNMNNSDISFCCEKTKNNLSINENVNRIINMFCSLYNNINECGYIFLDVHLLSIYEYLLWVCFYIVKDVYRLCCCLKKEKEKRKILEYKYMTYRNLLEVYIIYLKYNYLNYSQVNYSINIYKNIDDNIYSKHDKMKNIFDILKIKYNSSKEKEINHMKICEEEKEINHMKICEEEKEINHMKICEEEKEINHMKICEEEKEINHMKICEEEKEINHMKICEEEKEINHMKICEEEKEINHMKICEEEEEKEKNDYNFLINGLHKKVEEQIEDRIFIYDYKNNTQKDITIILNNNVINISEIINTSYDTCKSLFEKKKKKKKKMYVHLKIK